MIVFYMIMGTSAIGLLIGLQRNGMVVRVLTAERKTEDWKFFEFGTLFLRLGMGLFFILLVYSQLPIVETWEEFNGWISSTSQTSEGQFILVYFGIQFGLGVLLLIGPMGKAMRRFVSLVWFGMVFAQGFGDWPHPIEPVTLAAFNVTLSPEQLLAIVSMIAAASYFTSSFKKHEAVIVGKNY